MKKRSEKLIEELKALRHSQSSINTKLNRAWHRMRKDGNDTEKLNNAQSKIYEAEVVINEMYAEQIGKAIVREI